MANYIKSFITAKIGSPLNICDDHFAYNLDKLNFAVSDGASCNLASRIYSRLLVDNFAEYGRDMLSENIRGAMCDTWKSETDQMINLLGNPYYLRNMFISRKEAAATFVGLSIYNDATYGLQWDAFVLGDSVLVHIPADASLPDALYTTNKAEKTPEFSCSILFDNNPKTAHPYNSELWKNQVWEINNQRLKEGTFILMTDALAEWFIASNHLSTESKLSMLMQLNSKEEFDTFIDSERSVRLEDNTSPLHDDDVTLMILNIDNLSKLLERDSIEEKVKTNYRHVIELCAKQEVYDRMKGVVQKVEDKLTSKDEEEARIRSDKDEIDKKLTALEKLFQEKNKELEEKNKELEEKNKELEEKNKAIYNLSLSNEQLNKQISGQKAQNQYSSAKDTHTDITEIKDEFTRLWKSNEEITTVVSNINRQTQNIKDTLEIEAKERLEDRTVEDARNRDSQESTEEIKFGIRNIEKKNDSFLDTIQQLRLISYVIGGFSLLIVIMLLTILFKIVHLH